MCFRINKLSLGNYSLKQNKINIYTNKTHCERSTLKVEPVGIKCALQNVLDFSWPTIRDHLHAVKLRLH